MPDIRGSTVITYYGASVSALLYATQAIWLIELKKLLEMGTFAA